MEFEALKMRRDELHAMLTQMNQQHAICRSMGVPDSYLQIERDAWTAWWRDWKVQAREYKEGQA